jgi:hypothetical protein
MGQIRADANYALADILVMSYMTVLPAFAILSELTVNGLYWILAKFSPTLSLGLSAPPSLIWKLLIAVSVSSISRYFSTEPSLVVVKVIVAVWFSFPATASSNSFEDDVASHSFTKDISLRFGSALSRFVSRREAVLILRLAPKLKLRAVFD